MQLIEFAWSKREAAFTSVFRQTVEPDRRSRLDRDVLRRALDHWRRPRVGLVLFVVHFGVVACVVVVVVGVVRLVLVVAGPRDSCNHRGITLGGCRCLQMKAKARVDARIRSLAFP